MSIFEEQEDGGRIFLGFFLSKIFWEDAIVIGQGNVGGGEES